MSCEGGDCACKRPSIYSQELPPWPTLEEIRKVVRDEIQKAKKDPSQGKLWGSYTMGGTNG